jgi:hypothetical protein
MIRFYAGRALNLNESRVAVIARELVGKFTNIREWIRERKTASLPQS